VPKNCFERGDIRLYKKISKLCAFHIYEGLCDGLSHFSGLSRAAVIYATGPKDPMLIYDPQNLLEGHEPKLKELYIDSTTWRDNAIDLELFMLDGQPIPEKNLHLTGLISKGGRSRSIFYQMWFTEHHPDMCSIGPTERWLEHAVWLLSHDVISQDSTYLNTSGYVLREYATHAVRDYIIDELNLNLGMDIQIRIYPLLDAVLGISRTLEEGFSPVGSIVFIEPGFMNEIDFLLRFLPLERPSLTNFKHVVKLLLAVKDSERSLVSDGKSVIGIASGKMPNHQLSARFQSGHGFLCINDQPICSFYDGNFHSSTRKAKLVELEELIIESHLIAPDKQSLFFKMIMEIVHHAREKKYGCTLVIDLNNPPINLAGQKIEPPLDLEIPKLLDLTKSLSKMDGALHIGADLKLHGFACILDGLSIPNEDRARGARFNSALRFTSKNSNTVVIVVSADRPVSLIQEGVELTAHCTWRPISSHVIFPPTLEDWINR
jgi:hypothetical protein